LISLVIVGFSRSTVCSVELVSSFRTQN